MNVFDVSWDDGAAEELAEIWMKAKDPDDVRFTADYIEFQLHYNADGKGVEVSPEGLRKLAFAPLAVIYESDTELHTVTIVKVIEYPRN